MKVMLHPGEVVSKMDGDVHRISARQLIRLYGVLPSDEVIINDGSTRMAPWKYPDYWHLLPRYEGDYYDIHTNDVHATALPGSSGQEGA